MMMKLLLTCALLHVALVGGQEISSAPPPENCQIVRVGDDYAGLCEGTPEGPVDKVDESAMKDAVAKLMEAAPGMFDEKGMSADQAADFQDVPDADLAEDQTASLTGSKTSGCIVKYPETSSLSLAIPYQNCPQYYYWYRPHWAYVNSKWHRVANIPGNYWLNSYYWRWCKPSYCWGQSGPCGYWWKGRCVLRWTWRRVLIYTQYGLRWWWIRVPNGCCCEPWGYYDIMVGK